MATITGNGLPTLADLKSRMDPDGSISAIIEILNQQNDVLQDVPWMEGNETTGHLTTVRTGIPEPTWRRMNQGVQPTKSKTGQAREHTAMMENYSECDKALADLGGNTQQFRLSESLPIIEGMNQAFSDNLFYGELGENPERFEGLSSRFNSLSSSHSSDNVINASGTGSKKRSVWLIVWGENTVCGIYPKGHMSGLDYKDLGEVTIENANGVTGERMQAYRSHFKWSCGLLVKDWRYVVRIANVDQDTILTATPSLHEHMFQAIDLIPSMNMGKACFYMSRDIRTGLRIRSSREVKQSTLEVENVGGTPVMSFQGIPIRRVDALAKNETAVS